MAAMTAPTEAGMWADCQPSLTHLQDNNIYRTSTPHNDGGNMVYADGHAKWQGKNYLQAGWTPYTGAPWDIF